MTYEVQATLKNDTSTTYGPFDDKALAEQCVVQLSGRDDIASVDLVEGQSVDSVDNRAAIQDALTLHEAPPPDAIGQSSREVQALFDILEVDQWKEIDREVAAKIVRYLAARARYLQDEVDLAPEPAEQLDRLFPPLTVCVQEYLDTYVHGLSRGHEPQRGSWLVDARCYREELEEMIEEEA